MAASLTIAVVRLAGRDLRGRAIMSAANRSGRRTQYQMNSMKSDEGAYCRPWSAQGLFWLAADNLIGGWHSAGRRLVLRMTPRTID